MKSIRSYISIIVLIFCLPILKGQKTEPVQKVNYQYSPSWWQTTINLPEDPRKSLVGKNGQLLYEYPVAITDPKLSTVSGYNTSISFQTGENEVWKGQQLLKAEVPVVITQKEWKSLVVREEVFTVAPLLFGSNDTTIKEYLGTALSKKVTGRPGNDILIITIENKGSTPVIINPIIRINSTYSMNVDTSKGKVFLSDFLRVVIPYSIIKINNEPIRKNSGKSRNQTVLSLSSMEIGAGKKLQLAIGVSQGYTSIDCPNNVEQALQLQKQSITWWENLDLPYNKIIVPDQEIQNLLNASIRNIYQTIDRENNLIALKNGPSSNRQFNISDAPYIMDALTMLNQTVDVRKSIEYMLSLQRKDGSFQQQEKDWKETGLVLWAIANHARLTGDKQWLESVWSSLEKGYTFLMDLRNNTLQDSKASYAGLLPPGSGTNNQEIDFVNNYWGLAGLNSAITAARWVSRNGQAIKWQSQYDDYYRSFQESVKKNFKKDSYGNSYLPARISNDKKVIPQKSQWSFLNAVYPGKIFDMNDPVLTGNMKMLERSVKEGLLFNTGWMNNGIVLTTASDYAHALQWTGKAQEAANIMYAMANHAAPNYSWHEQQSLKEVTDTFTMGDMPNSRVSAEFIRLVRHLIVIERGYELHLMEGVPPAWTKPGMELKLEGILTDFGPLNFKIAFSADGSKATIDMNLDTNNRRPPQKILLHLDGIAGNPVAIELELKPNLHKVLTLDK